MRLVRPAVAVSIALLAINSVAPAPLGSPRYSTWSEPINLGSPINSTFNETAPSLSKDRLSLYFTSTRRCGNGDVSTDFNIWVAERPTEDAPWGPPECLGINVNDFEDSAADFSRDGHWMFFVSDRPGSRVGVPASNTRDIWFSYRRDVHDNHDWGAPVNADSLNTNFADAAVTYFEGDGTDWPQVWLASNRNGTFDIFQAAVFGDGTFGAVVPVDEINSAAGPEARPSIRFDGLEMFFFRGVQGSTVADIWVTSRNDTSELWSAPINLGAPVSTPSNEQQPFISSDRETLYFVSNRTGTLGLNDVWVSTRGKANP